MQNHWVTDPYRTMLNASVVPEHGPTCCASGTGNETPAWRYDRRAVEGWNRSRSTAGPRLGVVLVDEKAPSSRHGMDSHHWVQSFCIGIRETLTSMLPKAEIL